MKIQLASDLHLEFLVQRWPNERTIWPAEGADVLVLAGDISSGNDAIKRFADWPVPVLYVAGNHEFYHRKMEKVRAELEAPAEGAVRYLENQAVVLGGVRFLACTLWTDYRLNPEATPDQSMAYASFQLSDHTFIKLLNRRKFMPFNALQLHQTSRAWLISELAKPFDGKTVVITHHGPHPGSTHQRYKGDPLNPAFVSDLSPLMEGVDLWLHGHVHDSFDYKVGRCRVVANPCGYPVNYALAKRPEHLQFENEFFQHELVLEV